MFRSCSTLEKIGFRSFKCEADASGSLVEGIGEYGKEGQAEALFIVCEY